MPKDYTILRDQDAPASVDRVIVEAVEPERIEPITIPEKRSRVSAQTFINTIAILDQRLAELDTRKAQLQAERAINVADLAAVRAAAQKAVDDGNVTLAAVAEEAPK